jgi:hypothetical protein
MEGDAQSPKARGKLWDMTIDIRVHRRKGSSRLGCLTSDGFAAKMTGR